MSWYAITYHRKIDLSTYMRSPQQNDRLLSCTCPYKMRKLLQRRKPSTKRKSVSSSQAWVVHPSTTKLFDTFGNVNIGNKNILNDEPPETSWIMTKVYTMHTFFLRNPECSMVTKAPFEHLAPYTASPALVIGVLASLASFFKRGFTDGHNINTNGADHLIPFTHILCRMH